MRQRQLRAQLFGTGADTVGQATTIGLDQLCGKRLQQTLQLGIAGQIGTFHLQGQAARRTRCDHEAWRQALADGQHYGIGQLCRIGRRGSALLAGVAQPQAPGRLPLTAIVLGLHRQQGIWRHSARRL